MVACVGFVACSVSELPALPSTATSSDVCGNNVVEGSEACDDGNLNDNDGCLNSCALASCGDGIVRVDVDSQTEGFEACDDGNALNTDGCLATCRLPACGDGFLRNDLDPSDPNYEQCDDASDGCNRCRIGCGNGVQEAGEACDDGNSIDADACTNSCALAICGDGVRRIDVQAGEEAYEECDDGNSDDTDTCTRTCLNATCGDGFRSGSEACDDRNDNNFDACTNACQNAQCGDGFRRLDVGGGRPGFEECDDGNLDNTDDCVDRCQLRRCGDNFVAELHEGCDDGNQIEDDSCRSNCSLTTCGDGQLDEYEHCDDGNVDDNDSCTGICLPARCGDGVLRNDLDPDHPRYEACDDGNLVDTDGCLNNCTLASCGDGVVRQDLARRVPGFEDCDPEDPQTAEGCINCRRGCGDGVLDVQSGEDCDDGNDADADGCRNDCESAACGDGVLRLDRAPTEEGYEACDDGNTVTGDGCSADCGFIEVADIWAGEEGTCVSYGDGRAECWGWGNSTTFIPMKRWVAGQVRVRRAMIGTDRGCPGMACILNDQEQVICNVSGVGDAGRPGARCTATSYQWTPGDEEPIPLRPIHSGLGEPIEQVVQLGLGRDLFCALTRQGSVYCWPHFSDQEIYAYRVESPNEFSVMTVTDGAACGITRQSRSVECWGKNSGHHANRIPAALSGIRGVHSLARRPNHIVALSEEAVSGWASGSGGYLPLNEAHCSSAQHSVRVIPWGDESPWVSVAVIQQTSCGVNAAGAIRCVGNPLDGSHFSDCLPEQWYMPRTVELPNAERAQQIVGGANHFCARSTTGKAYCWGGNAYGQVGLGTDDVTSPVLVAP